MDETRRTRRTGHVEPTPEARPLTPPTMQDHFAGQGAPTAGGSTAGQTAQAGAAGGAGSSAPHDKAEEIGREVTERLKPVAAAAEEVAAKGNDISAKVLHKLVDMLEERRRHREGGGG